MTDKSSKKMKWMMAVSMIIFGTLGPFTRQIVVSSGELALYRAVLAVILIAGYLAVTRQKLDVGAMKREMALLLISGMAIGINRVLLFQAYRYTAISTATLSYYFAPVIVTVVCPFLFQERLTGKQALCFVMSTVGLVMIIGIGSPSRSETDVTGILFGLGAAVFYAAVILMNKLIKGVTGIPRTLVQFLGAALILSVYVAGTGGTHLEALDMTGVLCLLVVGLIHTGVTYCMYFTALKELSGQEAAILSYLDPLTAVLVSVFILGERMTIWQMMGGALILGFTLWNEKNDRRKGVPK